jgi:hypothetical protein
MSKGHIGFLLLWVFSVTTAYYLGYEKITMDSVSQFFSDDLTKLSQAKADDEKLWKIIHGESEQVKKKESVSGDLSETFDLYQLLPNMDVILDDGGVSTPVKSSVKKQGLAKSYMLQAGAFSKASDAERFKVSLALLGLESAVQQVNIKGRVAFRVRVGPYKDKTTLNAANKLLKKNGIDAFAVAM